MGGDGLLHNGTGSQLALKRDQSYTSYGGAADSGPAAIAGAAQQSATRQPVQQYVPSFSTDAPRPRSAALRPGQTPTSKPMPAAAASSSSSRGAQHAVDYNTAGDYDDDFDSEDLHSAAPVSRSPKPYGVPPLPLCSLAPISLQPGSSSAAANSNAKTLAQYASGGAGASSPEAGPLRQNSISGPPLSERRTTGNPGDGSETATGPMSSKLKLLKKGKDRYVV